MSGKRLCSSRRRLLRLGMALTAPARDMTPAYMNALVHRGTRI